MGLARGGAPEAADARDVRQPEDCWALARPRSDDADDADVVEEDGDEQLHDRSGTPDYRPARARSPG